MKKELLFRISIIISIIMLFFSLKLFWGFFSQMIEVSAFEEVFEPEKGLVVFFYGVLTTFALGIIFGIFHGIIFILLRKSPEKIIPLNALLKTKNPYLKCIFILILVFSVLGFYWITAKDNSIFYYMPFFILFPICAYILLGFTTVLHIKKS